jgi:Ti-type conjugative transfer relaxase TraA
MVRAAVATKPLIDLGPESSAMVQANLNCTYTLDYFQGCDNLAIYHLTATVISRARGQRIVATAAARSATRLYDEQYGITHNHTGRTDVIHSEILAPPGAPGWVSDRSVLWNKVEAGERRKDAQLARSIEISLPRELTPEANIGLVREYLAQEFVSKGMIADFCIRQSNPENPQAHILLTLREATSVGFGPKARQWNRKSNLLDWRCAWADRANVHLARAGHAARIDHRTIDAQNVELTPSRRIGLGRGLRTEHPLPAHMEQRLAEQQRIATENGAAILQDPSIAIRALAQQRRTFSLEELVGFLRTRTGDAAQFDAALRAVMESPELMPATAADENPLRFTSRDFVEAEKSLTRRVATMANRRGHAADSSSDTPHDATLAYLVSAGDFRAVAAAGMTDKSRLVGTARQVWTAAGFRVICAASSGTAVTELDAASGIDWGELSALESEWLRGEDPMTKNDVVVVDGAEMIDLKRLERLLAIAEKARAKVVLVGNLDQLHAMGDTSPLTALIGVGGAS